MYKDILFTKFYKTLHRISPFHIAVALLIAALCWFTIFGNQGLYRLHELKKTNQKMRHEISSLKEQIKDRENQITLFSDPVYLEKIVRQELGYVKPYEVIFQLSP